MKNTLEQTIHIQTLHVDDCEKDRFLMQRFLRQSRFKFTFHNASDGQVAMDLLTTNQVSPHLILLDLHMPRKTGFQVIEEIKAMDDLKNIPLVVFSSCSSSSNILNIYDPSRNLFLLKPNLWDGFIYARSILEQFLDGIFKQSNLQT